MAKLKSGNAIRLVAGGIRTAWLRVPSTLRADILAAAQKLITRFADGFSCDLLGIPIVEIGLAIYENPKGAYEEYFTVIARLTGINFPNLLWYRCQIGEKILWTCSYATNIKKARRCALRLYEHYVSLDSDGTKALIDKFEIGYRFDFEGKKGPNRFRWFPYETVTADSFDKQQTSREYADEVTEDHIPANKKCYGFFANDFCGPIEPPKENRLQPSPDATFRCSVRPGVYNAKRYNDPVERTFRDAISFSVKEPPLPFAPSRLLVKYLYLDRYHRWHTSLVETLDPDTGEVFPPIGYNEYDFPRPIRHEEYFLTDQSGAPTIDPDNVADTAFTVHNGAGDLYGSSTTEFVTQHFFRYREYQDYGPLGIPFTNRKEVNGPRFHMRVNAYGKRNSFVVPVLGFPTTAVRKFVEMTFFYPKAEDPRYLPGYGQSSLYELKEEGCYGTRKNSDRQYDSECQKGWKAEGLCMHYDYCGSTPHDIKFNLCIDVASKDPKLIGEIEIPAYFGDKYGGASITLSSDGHIDLAVLGKEFHFKVGDKN